MTAADEGVASEDRHLGEDTDTERPPTVITLYVGLSCLTMDRGQWSDYFDEHHTESIERGVQFDGPALTRRR